MNFLRTPLTHAQIFWLCTGIYCLAWTIVPALSIANVPIDTIEGYAWGHEWQLGSYKHPPLTGWVLEALAVITHRADWASFLANELADLATFWAVWQTGRRIVSENAALIGALLLFPIPYYNIIVPEFNPNILQLPFWALAGLSFHKAVRENKTADWLLLGLWGAAALYTKYSSLLLLASLAALLVLHPDGRRRLRSPGPWLALAMILVLLVPHIAWLFKNNFLPFSYAHGRLEHPAFGLFDIIIAPALFIFWQAATLLPAAAVYIFSFGAPKAITPPHSFDRAFLYFVGFCPAAITAVIAVATEGVIRNMWATPFWNFIGLWAVFCFQPVLTRENLRRFASVAILIFIAGLAGFFCVEKLGPYVTHNTKRINFSGARFAQQISQIWHDRYHQPLHYVVGDTWIGGNIAWYAPDRPRQLIDGDYKISPWINADDIKKYGGVIVWCGHCNITDKVATPAYIHDEFPQAVVQPSLVFPQNTGAKVPDAMVEWAIIPPAGLEEYP